MFSLNKKALVTGAVMALGMAVSGGAVAQNFTPTGPIAINGFISANNTAKGGAFTDFRCKVEGWGFVTDASTGTLRIDFLRPLNESSGQIPQGCHTVVTALYPWTVTTGVPAGAGALQTTNIVTVTGASFQAPGQPGCGYSGTTPVGSVITTGMTWSQSNPAFPAPSPQGNNTHSRLEFTNSIVDEPGTGPNCTLNGVLKFSRWTSLRVQ